MAKKKQNLSPEEMLEQALVPDHEWPYQLPNNWVWTKMQFVASWGSGGTPSRRVPEYYDGNIPWIKTGELNYGYVFETEEHISEVALKKSSAKLYPVNTVMIAMYGATIGKVAIMGIPATTNQACACAVANSAMYYKYLFYYAISQQDTFVELGKGGAQPNISQEVIKSHFIPLPPIAEQQRIVDRIESLFEKLDQAKELIQDALDSFENRKAAILHKAFSGELTKQWREENGVGMESWKEVVLGEYASTNYGYTESAQNENVGPKFLRITDIQEGIVTWGSVPYCPISDDDYLKYKLNIGDIVVARTGATTGKSYMIIDDIDAVFASYLIRINIMRSDLISSEFLYKFLQSQQYWNQITELSSGIAQPGVNASKLKSILVPLPSILEQNEIVEILDTILEKEIQSKELLAIANNIDIMKKSILSRAFRGEIGTNDPSEGSAIHILKKIFTEKAGELK